MNQGAVGDHRILYLSARLPTAIRNGLDLRVRNQVLASAESFPTGIFSISGSGESISPLIEIWSSGSDPEPARGVATQIAVKRGVRDPKGPYWMRFSEQTGREFLAAVHEFRPTIIVFERLDVVPYLELTRSVFSGPVVLDLDEVSGPHNKSFLEQTTDVQERFTRRIWAQLVDRYEAQVVLKFDRIWVSSEDEASNFRKTYGESISISVVHNSIDINSYETAPVERVEKRIVFTGNFGYLPNVNAVHFLIKEVLPLLPEHTLDIVGSHTSQSLRELNNPQVNVIGEVKNVAPFLRRGSVAVVPIFTGGGTRLKVLEAMACGTPVVGTPFGVGGHDLTSNENVVFAQSAQEFAAAIEKLDSDDVFRHELTVNALDHVSQKRSLSSLSALLKCEFTTISC